MAATLFCNRRTLPSPCVRLSPPSRHPSNSPATPNTASAGGHCEPRSPTPPSAPRVPAATCPRDSGTSGFPLFRNRSVLLGHLFPKCATQAFTVPGWVEASVVRDASGFGRITTLPATHEIRLADQRAAQGYVIGSSFRYETLCNVQGANSTHKN